MPPKNANRKRAKPGPEEDDTAQLDIALQEIDLIADNLKEDIERLINEPLDEIRKLVNRHIMMLPSKVASMRMADFLREGGGSISAVLEKQKKEARAARTAMKPVLAASRLGGAGAGLTSSVKPAGLRAGAGAAAGSSAPSLNAAMDGVENTAPPVRGAGGPLPPPVVGPSAAGGSAAAGAGAGAGAGSSSSGLPMTTPMAGGPRSRIGGAGAGAGPIAGALKTPAIGLMKSTQMLPMALGAQTPGISGYLPKTPGPDAGKLPRARRRNEVVYHATVALSSNMSPLDPSEAGDAGAAMPAALIPVAAAGAGGATMAPMMALAVATADGTQQAVRLDDMGALEELVTTGDDAAAQATLDTLKAMMERMQAAEAAIRNAQAAKAASLAMPSAAAASAAAAAGAGAGSSSSAAPLGLAGAGAAAPRQVAAGAGRR